MTCWIFSCQFCLSERRKLSFTESFLPLTGCSRLVLFYFELYLVPWWIDRNTGWHAPLHLYKIWPLSWRIRECLCNRASRVRQSSVHKSKQKCTLRQNSEIKNQVKRFEETERLPHISQNKTSSTKNTHLSCLPVYPQLIVSAYNSLIPSQCRGG